MIHLGGAAYLKNGFLRKWEILVFRWGAKPPKPPHLLLCGIGVCGKKNLRDRVLE